ncbi:MAG: type pilus assembly protein PilB, partial [Pseudonocardiales bacterium]|nr:type pilus assembly protein PilB [Pseudonocardiales bacterium]
ELAFLRAIGGDAPDDGFVHGAGCNFCAKTGYLERTGVYEMLMLSDGIREQVLDRASHDDLRKLARAEGMSTLLEEAVALVRDGTTNLAEIMRSVYVMGV